MDDLTLSRRELLKTGAASIACAAALGSPLEALARDGLYGPFRVGIQSYSLRGMNFADALEATRKFGLLYWESFQAHIPFTDDAVKIKATLEAFKTAGVRLWGWGVQGFDGNEANARKYFVFARALGLKTISADRHSIGRERGAPLMHATEYKMMPAKRNRAPAMTSGGID